MLFHIICFFSNLFPPFSHGGPAAEKVIFPDASCNTGTAGHLLIVFFFPCWWGCCHLIVQPCAVLPWVGVGAGKVLITIFAVSKLFSLTLLQWHSGVLPQQSWTSAMYILSLCVSPGQHSADFSPNLSERGWGRFTGPLVPQHIPRSACLLPDEPIVKLFLGPSAHGVGSQISHKDIIFCGWMSNYFLKKELKKENVLHYYHAGVTPICPCMHFCREL